MFGRIVIEGEMMAARSDSVIGDVNATEVCEMNEGSARTATRDAELPVVSPADDDGGLFGDHKHVAGFVGSRREAGRMET